MFENAESLLSQMMGKQALFLFVYMRFATNNSLLILRIDLFKSLRSSIGTKKAYAG